MLGYILLWYFNWNNIFDINNLKRVTLSNVIRREMLPQKKKKIKTIYFVYWIQVAVVNVNFFKFFKKKPLKHHSMHFFFLLYIMYNSHQHLSLNSLISFHLHVQVKYHLRFTFTPRNAPISDKSELSPNSDLDWHTLSLYPLLQLPGPREQCFKEGGTPGESPCFSL